MIEVKIDNQGELTRFMVSGSQLDVASEIGLIVSAVYGQVLSLNPGAAEGFQKMVLAGMMPDSPVWKNPVRMDGSMTAVIPIPKKGGGGG